MRKLKKFCFVFMALLLMIPKAWAMQNCKEENDYPLFASIRLSKETENTTNNKIGIQKLYPWKTISDFVVSGAISEVPSLHHKSASHHFYPFIYKIYELILINKIEKNTNIAIQKNKKNEKIIQKKLSRVGALCTIYDYILNKSLDIQLLDHQLGDKIYAFSEINSALHHAFVSFNEKDLTVFDVDDTLTVILDPFYTEHVIKNTSLYNNFLSIEENLRGRFFYWILNTAPCTLIEPQTAHLISALQARKFKLMALTAFRPLFFQEEPKLKSLPTWRVELLKRLGIDFSKSFPGTSRGWEFDTTRNQNFPEPYFERGVLFSGLAGKPVSLLNFLHTVSFKPKKVLFIDDDLGNVISVYRELTRLGIKCYSILYTRVNLHTVNSMFSASEFDTYLKRQEEFAHELCSSSGKWPRQSNFDLIRVWKKKK